MLSLNNSIKVLFFIPLSTVLFAYSPNDLTGYKVALTITNSSDVSQGEETHTFYFKSNTSALEKAETMANGTLTLLLGQKVLQNR